MMNGLTAVYQGVWLGLLSGTHLREITARHYAKADSYRSDDHNLQGFFDWEVGVFHRFFRDCQTIMLGAAGGGREIVALARLGKTVSAFECQPALVESARHLLKARAIDAELVLAKPDHVPASFGSFDGLILGWGGYAHIAGRGARIDFLKQFRTHVDTGGPILISFFVNSAVSRKMRWTFRIARVIRRIRLSREPVELRDALCNRYEHYFTEDEVRAELEAAGFELVYYAAEPFGHAVGRAV
ncbi:MAG: class I SAM-dependent methyltransferase [Chloroflexi bacterium]|nr:class I SAM-dependent methyltransferase [Chloroflexota bacterium]